MVKFRLDWHLETDKKTKLWLPFPITDGNQKLLSYSFTKKPDNLVLTDRCNYAYFEPDRNFKVTAHLEMDVKEFGSYPASKPESFLEIEPEMQSDEVKKLAKELKTPRAFYEWIIKNIRFPDDESIESKYLEDLREGTDSVQEIMDSKTAECSGKSTLFVALCRNVRIPARTVDGYFLKEGRCKTFGTKLDESFLDIHVWVEFYQGGEWHPVDCSIAQQFNKDCFGKFDDLRVAVCKGTNIKLHNREKPVYSLQTGFFDDAKNLTLELKFE
jgi:transglutaminase-like putative cysteine protease